MFKDVRVQVAYTWNICGWVGCLEMLWLDTLHTRKTYVRGGVGGWVGWGV